MEHPPLNWLDLSLWPDKRNITNHVTNAQHLAGFGLTVLTGEACALGMRLLYDVETEFALDELQEFFCAELHLRPAWNHGVGSIMLPFEITRPLAIFLMTGWWGQVWVSNNTADIHGIEEESFENARAIWGGMGYRCYQHRNIGHGQSRNRHQMTGRVI